MDEVFAQLIRDGDIQGLKERARRHELFEQLDRPIRFLRYLQSFGDKYRIEGDRNARGKPESLEERDKHGQTLLMYAAYHERVSSVGFELILSALPHTVNQTDNFGNTPLMMVYIPPDAISDYQERDAIFRMLRLLDSGAQINAYNDDDQTFFSRIVGQANVKLMTQALIRWDIRNERKLDMFLFMSTNKRRSAINLHGAWLEEEFNRRGLLGMIGNQRTSKCDVPLSILERIRDFVLP